MESIIALLISNPKEALTAGYQAVELISKLTPTNERNPSIQAILIEIRKGCHETSLEFRNNIREFKQYCEQNSLNTDQTLSQIYNDESWFRPHRKISLNFQMRKIGNVVNHFLISSEIQLACSRRLWHLTNGANSREFRNVRLL